MTTPAQPGSKKSSTTTTTTATATAAPSGLLLALAGLFATPAAARDWSGIPDPTDTAAMDPAASDLRILDEEDQWWLRQGIGSKRSPRLVSKAAQRRAKARAAAQPKAPATKPRSADKHEDNTDTMHLRFPVLTPEELRATCEEEVEGVRQKAMEVEMHWDTQSTEAEEIIAEEELDSEPCEPFEDYAADEHILAKAELWDPTTFRSRRSGPRSPRPTSKAAQRRAKARARAAGPVIATKPKSGDRRARDLRFPVPFEEKSEEREEREEDDCLDIALMGALLDMFFNGLLCEA